MDWVLRHNHANLNEADKVRLQTHFQIYAEVASGLHRASRADRYLQPSLGPGLRPASFGKVGRLWLELNGRHYFIAWYHEIPKNRNVLQLLHALAFIKLLRPPRT